MSNRQNHRTPSKRFAGRQALVAALASALAFSASAAQIVIHGPPGSGSFGDVVRVLPNGNIVVIDSTRSTAQPNVGAVYLYNPSGVLISELTGGSANDRIGSGGGSSIAVLSNGNFVVCSPNWQNAGIVAAGAATWINGATGLSGVVSPGNSLVGTSSSDRIGFNVAALTNGNYVVYGSNWDNGGVVDAGAVTWADGRSGRSGTVSPNNSLVGTTAGDRVGSLYVKALNTGNYLVFSPNWDNAGVVNAGAVTWADGNTGLIGQISPANSLVGASAGDRVGSIHATELATGKYVLRTPEWHNGAAAGAGAVTLCDRTAGCTGFVTSANSLVGTQASDAVGLGITVVLGNSNYLVRSPNWSRDGAARVGAVTWVDGSIGLIGAVSATNSLVGATANDQVGFMNPVVLTNGNYAISSPDWDNGPARDAGAVTWGSAPTGVAGAVSSSNSLVGSTIDDHVGGHGSPYSDADADVIALSNGHYVVSSPYWDNGAIADAGAVTWGNGDTGKTGVVTANNSLVGGHESDLLGGVPVPTSYGTSNLVALRNGYYVVNSPFWDRGTDGINVGAVTLVDGSVALSGAISSTNSLIGAASYHALGSGGVFAVGTSNFVICSPYWADAARHQFGALTWVSSSLGLPIAVSSANSLVGMTAADSSGACFVGAFADANYAIGAPLQNNAYGLRTGAVTLANGDVAILAGVNTTSNSIEGQVPTEFGSSFPYDYDVARHRLVVGKPRENAVTVLTLSDAADIPWRSTKPDWRVR